MRIRKASLIGLVLAAALFCGTTGSAEIRPSSNIVLPYFEVDLRNIPEVSCNTLFSVNNFSDEPVDVVLSVRSNWGISVLDVQLTLKGDEVRSINLADWLIRGKLPDRVLSSAELENLQAVLSGRPAPRDQRYYSSMVRSELAVGSISIAAVGPGHRDVLWGDSFVIDPKIGFMEGETLIDVDRSVECVPDCARHGIRFLQGGGVDSSTELMIWTERYGRSSATAEPPADLWMNAQALVYNEAGHLIDRIDLRLLPVHRLKVADLGLTEPFGWIDIVTENNSFITAHYSAKDHYSAALQAYCLPAEEQGTGPGIRIDKLTNGAAADLPPGPKVPVGGQVQWTYGVTNTGDVPLHDISVIDSDGANVFCPGDTLQPGETMTCTASGAAQACQQSNTATATGSPPTGNKVSDSDTSHYYGEQKGTLTLESRVNGQDADTPTGPELPLGTNASWTYQVTNTGTYLLTGVTVTDQHGSPVSCPQTTLAPGESMTCTATAVTTGGQHAFTATAQGAPTCGPQVAASDMTHYYCPSPAAPAISIEKRTNGEDADTMPGPMLLTGGPVTWTYVVTNTGGVVLSAVAVSDDRGVVVTCPKTVLQPGESMTCTGSGAAISGNYRNVGTATGTPPDGPAVTSSDPSHYLGVRPRLQIEKLVNGFEADEPADAPRARVGSPVLWTYVVTNTGDVSLTGVRVADDRDLTVTCPKTALESGESMTCTANGSAVSGLFCNIGIVNATAPVGPALTDSDPACYVGITPGIAIEKRVNGEDADVPPGPTLVKDSPVVWTYQVTNTGDARLTGVSVTDDKGLTVSCPKQVLAVGESMVCTASGTAAPGQYCNLGTAAGTPPAGSAVVATDTACYLGIAPGISIEKLTNGQDADTPPGPTIPVGGPVLWTYLVTNTGDVALTQVQVVDNRGVTVTCPKTQLQASESMTCTASGTAVAGQYSNIGSVVGTPAGANPVSDSDPSYYIGIVPGDEGCTPGYWKNHSGSWPATGYSTIQKVNTVFSEASRFPALGNSTLHQALHFGGGSDLSGAAEILLRAAVAAVLNASHPGVDYPRTVAEVVAQVNSALASGNRDAMLALAAGLDADNNLGCPLH